MPMQIRRTSAADTPPTGLAEGQLAVEMASVPPKLWCGVPTTIDASGRIRLTPDPVGLFTSTAPGIVPASGGGIANFLRADGSWVAPPAPSAQQGDVRFDSGKLEQWDGSAWVEIPLGSKMGVTDGSNAAAGEIGEVLETSIPMTDNIGAINTANIIAGTLVLPSGDWIVQGNGYFYFSYTGPRLPNRDIFQISLYRNGLWVSRSDVSFSAALSANTYFFNGSTVPCRFNESSSVTIGLCPGTTTFVDAGVAATTQLHVMRAWIRARRMR